MNEFKGTPGPWNVIEHSWSDTSLVSGEKTIATTSIYNEATEETQEELESEVSANFRLIAAGPDLLEALIECVNLPYTTGDVYNRAKAAIAKALGEEVTNG